MKTLSYLFVAAVLVSPVMSAAETITFADAPLGTPPPGWLATKTGSGEPKWTVERDATAPTKGRVLKQSGDADYPLCLKNGTSLRDGFVEVKFLPISGTADQAGGVVWRARDANNYYVARANALEDNVRIYRVVAGKRVQFGGIDGVKVARGAWHTLRVEFAGADFAVIYDGKKMFTAKDAMLAEAGQVGVWTKADSVTAFAEFAFAAR